MNDKSRDDQAMITEALKRLKASKPGIPGDKVQQFLKKLQADLDLPKGLSTDEIRERFQRFVAEAAHVSG
jgi:D-mannonate dehydratase